MPWLVRDGEVLASLEIAEDRRSRRHGLLGRDGFDGAMWLTPARSVHTIGMRFDLDIAYLDRELNVLDTVCMRRHRLGRPRMRGRSVIEAEAGAFERWGLQVGHQLEVRR